MATGHRGCKHCGKRIDLRPQNPNQEYCKKPECQRERKRKWQRQKIKSDPDYRENQRDAARRWRAKNPDYWRSYRSRNKAYTQRNRQQQKLRNRRPAGPRAPNIANMDVSKPQNTMTPGRYQRITASGHHLKGMAGVFAEMLAKAQRQGWGHQQLLDQLFREELRHRRERSVQYRLSQARIPWSWALSTFPFDRQPVLDKSRIMSLAGLDFIQRGENIIFTGPTGTGKSGILGLVFMLFRKLNDIPEKEPCHGFFGEGWQRRHVCETGSA